jgi:SAM-dependent methyltransferase
VLDIGSGTGGPACYLARTLGCRVLGVDVSAVGHGEAEARAREGGLDHLARFRLGDIHALELPPAAFDVVLGLDSWCHIPRRGALLQRCAELLRTDGRVAFYDHVLREPLAEAERLRFCAVWRFADVESPASYLQALAAAGLDLLWHEETSAYVTRFYTRVLEGYRAERTRFEAARGPERYQQGLERLEMSQRLAAAGVLGQFGCVAVKRSR